MSCYKISKRNPLITTPGRLMVRAVPDGAETTGSTAPSSPLHRHFGTAGAASSG